MIQSGTFYATRLVFDLDCVDFMLKEEGGLLKSKFSGDSNTGGSITPEF